MTWHGNTTDANTSNQLGEESRRIMRARDSIEDAYTVLVLASDTIGPVLNNVVSKPTAFPILICGNVLMQDSLIILLLLLWILKVPEPIIENICLKLRENTTPGGSTHEAGESGFKNWTANRPHWAGELIKRMKNTCGSMNHYFGAAGVTQATFDRIRDGLLLTSTGEKENLVDILS